MTEAEFIKKVGECAKADMIESGILASVTIAQAILESGYGSTDLAVNANNFFGMKCSLSGNSWASAWDGVSKYTKKTPEDDGTGKLYYITADFRKYPDMISSVRDHSLYLLGAMNGSKLRYQGLKGETNYKTAIQLIKDGGYATDTKYVDKICNIIERFNLTQYDTKEVAKMEINKLLTNYNHNAGSVDRIKYIVIHYVGALGGAKANCEYYAGGDRQASAHYYCGFDGEIWQSVEDKNIAWHCGAKSYVHAECRNANSIGIEMCVRKTDTSHLNAEDKDWYFEDATVKTAIELTKYLMAKYNIPASHVIRHYDVTGKICPNPYVYNTTSHTWDAFKKAIGSGGSVTPAPSTEEMYRVRKSWADAKSQLGAYKVLANAKAKADENPGYTVYDSAGKAVYTKAGSTGGTFMVRVKIANLNIRKGPGYKTYASTGFIPVGSYTIVETKSAEGYTWGRLKSGAGWIALEHTERV